MQTELKHQEESASMRGKILKLEESILSTPEIQIHIEPKHYFVPGIYAREISIPKGTVITGKIHKTEHLCVLSKGDVSVYTEGGLKRIQASTVVHSMPGMKRVLYAHEDSVWINFHHHPTGETDLDKIDDIFTVNSFDEIDFKEQKKLEGDK